jgi:hypothetical protein
MGTEVEAIVRERSAPATVVRRGGGRPWGKLIVAATVIAGILAGVLSGFAAYQGSRERAALERGRAADAARWAGQADAWLSTRVDPEALERGRAADAARWAGQAAAWLAARQGEQQALDRGRRADAARWQAQAEAWLVTVGPPAR